jgi:hypothetical protein
MENGAYMKTRQSGLFINVYIIDFCRQVFSTPPPRITRYGVEWDVFKFVLNC